MILTIAKEKTITPKALGNEKSGDPSTVTFKVPTSADMEKLLTEKSGDNSVFKDYVVKTSFTDELMNPIKPSEIPSMPGVYSLVAEVAGEILMAGMLGHDEKK